MLVWGVIYTAPGVLSNWQGFTMMSLAWSITEVIRYSFYAFGLIGNTPYIILFLRYVINTYIHTYIHTCIHTYDSYTLFIILYPIGVTGELLLVYGAYNIVSENGALSVSLPNAWNLYVGMVWYLCYDCTSHFNIPSAPQRIYFTHSLARSSFSYAYYLVAFSLLYIPGECGGLHVTALY